MISFAQNFEDVMLYRVFRNRPTGFYIDVGAADPTHHSVTKWFYDLGWRGINIEPRRAFFESLQHARPRDINLNCAAGAESGDAVFYELSETHEWSSLDIAVRAAAVKRDETTVEHPIKIRQLSEIIENYASGQPIDFVKIDVEGWEPYVLKGLDLKKHRPIILVIEATKQGAPEQNDAAWSDTLVDVNYRCVYFDGLNKFFLDGRHQELASHFSVPPNVFDDFVLADFALTAAKLAEAERECARRLDVIEQSDHERLSLLGRLGELSKQLQDVAASKTEIETECEHRLVQIHALTATVNEVKQGSDARLAQIHTLTAMVNEVQQGSDARLAQIHTLTAMVNEVQQGSEARLAQIHTLTAMVNEVQQGSDARLAQIHTLAAMVQSAQATIDAHLEEIHRLTKALHTISDESATRERVLDNCRSGILSLEEELKEVKDDLAELETRYTQSLSEIADLAPRAAQHDLLLSDLRVGSSGPYALRIVLPLARALRKSAAVFGNFARADKA